MIEVNVKKLLAEIKGGNCFHEPVTLVAATKTRTAEEINRAIMAGVTEIGETEYRNLLRSTTKSSARTATLSEDYRRTRSNI